MYKCQPDDPRLVDMDPVQKFWMYENWIADQNDKAELAKNIAYLLASFDHPEAVKQIMGGGNVFESTDEELEESSRMVREMNLKSLGLNSINDLNPDNNQSNRRKKRKLKLKE